MNVQKVGVLMVDGKDERHNSNRKVTREALGNRYAEIGVGFGDDPRVQKDIAEQKEMWGNINPAEIASQVSELDEESDAESAYRVAMDNDGVDTPQKFDKNTDGW